MRVLVSVVTTALLAAAGCASGDPEPVTAPAGAHVVRVIDGDTLVVRAEGTESTIRLLGIDTPESVKPNSPVECFGPEASARTEQLLRPGTAVRLQRDVTQDAVDDFGRTLAYVYAANAARSVNEQLVVEGYARVFIAGGRPFRLEPRFTRAEEAAREAARGLWGACRLAGAVSEGVPPEGRACPESHPIKGNLPSRIYHRAGDPDYERVNPERCFANAASAGADGFRPVRGR